VLQRQRRLRLPAEDRGGQRRPFPGADGEDAERRHRHRALRQPDRPASVAEPARISAAHHRAPEAVKVALVWSRRSDLLGSAGKVRVVKVFGEARSHAAFLYANRRSSRMKALVHDVIGVWPAARGMPTHRARRTPGIRSPARKGRPLSRSGVSPSEDFQ